MKLESEISADLSATFQVRGALFAVDECTEKFVFASENAKRFVPVSAANRLVGKSVRDVLGREITHAMRNAETMPSLERRRQHVGQHTLSEMLCDLSVFRVGSFLILEAVRRTADRDPTAQEVVKDVEVFTDVLLSRFDIERRLARFVALMRTMSGFHCVSLERRTESGVRQIAASGRTELAAAMCDGREQLHSVYDVSLPGVGLVGREEHEIPPLDMSALRIPSEDRLSSCREVGVRSIASIGLRWGEQIQGTLKFLHEKPRTPNKRTEFAVSHLAPLIGQTLSHLE